MTKRTPETEPRRRMGTSGLRARAWWVIRNRKVVTMESLLNTLADGNQKDAESNLRKYLSGLVKAGIIKIEAKKQPGKSLTSNGFNRYALVIDCGIAAPVIRTKLNEVYAPDLRQAYPMDGGVQ